MTPQAPPRTPTEMAELLDSLATAADRMELSYSETAHIARNAAATVKRLILAVGALMDNIGGHHHWDASGMNGVNCPTCQRQREAMILAGELISPAREP